jgi:beta-glucosidase/6-phospho-beta-glucosidase/beta-galactosidase
MYGFRLPEDFLIGTANSAFQSEGAMDRDGKSENIMEYYAKLIGGKYRPGVNEEEARAKGMKPYSADLPEQGCFFCFLIFPGKGDSGTL